MDMKYMTSWVGIAVLFCGCYCLYAAYQMKWKGVINTNLLLPKNMAFKKCKDTQGYIKEMFPTLLIFAIATTLCGAIDIVNSFLVSIEIAYYISLVLFLLSLVLFMVKAKKTREKYY